MDRAMLFGKYCLLERISVGGMAEVFRAKPLPAHKSDKMLALKRILPHLAEDDEFITMFVDEAKLTVQLDHPNIVETYELGNFQSSYYILMEFIAGADVLKLQKRLRENRRIMSVVQACYVAEKVARGLHHAHTARDQEGQPFNIIHRDVSPQNIRLTWDGRVKLIDFGIAKAAVQRTQTQVGVLKGKFGYMSPEQVQGEEIDHRSDVFALGTTLSEMLTNRRLFNGENEYETLQMVKHPEIPRPIEKNSQVPGAVDDIVMRALHEDRDERFQTAEALADALGDFIGGLRHAYGREHLSDWMAETFASELAEERRKRELYQEITTAKDVRWFNREYADEPPEEEAASGETVVEGNDAAQSDGEEEERLWDPEFAPDAGEEVDHEAFAAEHTMVAAGGFEPEDFEDEQDEFISLEDDDIIEVEEGQGAEGLTAGIETPEEQQSLAGSAPVVEGEPGRGAGGASVGDGRSGSSRTGRPRARSVTSEIETGRPGDRGEGDWLEELLPSGVPTVSVGDEELDVVRPAVTAAALFAAMVTSVGVLYLLVAPGGAGFAASLVVEVEPGTASGGEIRLGDREPATVHPATFADLKPGEHQLQVSYPGFETVERSLQLESGRVERLSVELTPTGEERGRLRLRMDEMPGQTEIYVDGKRREVAKRRLMYDLPAGEHLVEARAPGKYPWSKVVELEPGVERVERVQLRSFGARIRFRSKPEAKVIVDGEKYGRTPVLVGGLDPRELHRVELEEIGGRRDWESVLGFPELGQNVLTVDFEDPLPEREREDYGELTVSTGNSWWNVLVDGRPTGVTTPVETNETLPVRVGSRRIQLRRGTRTHTFERDVDSGRTTSIVQTLEFEWTASDT